MSRSRVIPKSAVWWFMLILVATWLAWQYQQRRAVLAEKEGIRAAMAQADKSRRPGEPLITCNPMLHACAFPYTVRKTELFTYGSTGRYPFYHGTAVMRPEDYFDPDNLKTGRYQWIWTLDATNWGAEVYPVPMPQHWSLVAETPIPEFYCKLILRLYRWNGEASVDVKTTFLEKKQ